MAEPTDATAGERSAQAHQDAPKGATPRISHGSSTAAWTTVGLVLLAQVVSAAGVIVASPPLFWIGVGGVGAALVVGKLLSMAGFGALPSYEQVEPGGSSLEGPDISRPPYDS